MSIPGGGSPLLLGGGPQQYKTERSIRLNASDSAYLSRTPASAGNRKTWTWSGWVKRSSLTAVEEHLWIGGIGQTTDSTYQRIYFDSSNKLRVAAYSVSWRTTAQVFRDFSAWFHLVVAVDTTQATASNRVRVYVNGSEITAFDTLNDPTLNADTGTNNNTLHYIGAESGPIRLFNGYLADLHLIDGQQLTPSSFAETNGTTGQWVPKAYSGSYGTNGFQLKFADNSAATATTLGKDTSGNGNNWTPNNLSVTAGAGNDSLVDTPTSYGTDDGLGGSVRGNYATWNPLVFSAPTLSNGNLDTTGNAVTWYSAFGSIQMPSSGKWYWEVTIGHATSVVGMSKTIPSSNTYLGGWADSYGWYGGVGNKVQGPSNTQTSYASFAASDVVGVAYDAGAGTLTFYKNGSSQGSAFTGLSGEFYPVFSAFGNGVSSVNFGQRSWAYAAPAGFKALCDTNLPAPTIAKGNTVMDVALWTGNGSARSITGLNFNPDLVWIKGRSGATDHALYDVVRGTEKRLESNTTDAEVTSDGGVTAFNGDGFSLGTLAQVNTNSSTYVGWAWDGGTSTVTNTQGSITSQVRANPSAGFSIVTYTGTGANASVGHGLGVAPKWVIVKRRNGASDWCAWVKEIYDSSNSSFLFLNATDASFSNAGVFNSSATTSTTFPVGTNAATNAASDTYVAYCFAPVAGYSSFGSYTGNGSSDGPFVFTGMRPRWIMLKRTDSTGNWTIIDTAREGYNVDNDPLYPNLSDAEGTADLADILSNGFKLRSTDTSVNASAGTYVYACFAEAPFALARAR